jgi:hypothetical protein
MSICQECDREMLSAASCTISELHIDGVALPLLPYGRDGSALSGPPSRCGDCGAGWGGFHHLGCDLQRCPRCRAQLLGCGCPFDEFGGRSDTDDDCEDDEPAYEGVDIDEDNPCPSCGARSVIPIIYGSPTPMLAALSQHGLVEVAGRAFGAALPSSRCRVCRHAWRRG